MQYPSPICLRALLLSALFVLAGCSTVGEPIRDVAGEINATLSSVRRVTEVGDTISVVFPYRTDWNHETRIRDDGFATFILVGEVQVVNLSIKELNQKLQAVYREQRQSDEVELTANVLPSAASGSNFSNVVFVIGDVNTPGAIELTGRQLTLFEAISAAGGHMKRTANLRNTLLIRRVRGSNEMRSWALDADIYKWGSQPPVFLQERDVVFVPNTAVDDVNIWIDQYIRQMIPLPALIPRFPAGAL